MLRSVGLAWLSGTHGSVVTGGDEVVTTSVDVDGDEVGVEGGDVELDCAGDVVDVVGVVTGGDEVVVVPAGTVVVGAVVVVGVDVVTSGWVVVVTVQLPSPELDVWNPSDQTPDTVREFPENETVVEPPAAIEPEWPALVVNVIDSPLSELTISQVPGDWQLTDVKWAEAGPPPAMRTAPPSASATAAALRIRFMGWCVCFLLLVLGTRRRRRTGERHVGCPTLRGSGRALREPSVRGCRRLREQPDRCSQIRRTRVLPYQLDEHVAGSEQDESIDVRVDRIERQLLAGVPPGNLLG